MTDLVEQILEGNYTEANQILEETMMKKLASAFLATKKIIAAKKYGNRGEMRSLSNKPLKKINIKPKMANEDIVNEEEELAEARISIVKARIRGGKIQRRKRVSNVPGMTIRGGKLTRMSPAERRRRRLGAKRAKIKVRGKRSQILRKRKVSLMKRKRLGI
jgi:hypothetical protein